MGEENEHPRKCSNWLADFLKWTLPRSEAKESYIFWTGLYTLSCVLRRHVKVGKEYLGSWECYPFLYLLFLGPAGLRKTTTVNYNVDLLDEIPGLISSPDQITIPKLMSALSEAEECAMYINAGELSEFVAKAGEDMYSFLTKAYDGAKRLSTGTHVRDLELADKPCINLIGASTLETLTRILPQSALDGGFGRRCIFVYEEDMRRRKMLYKDVNVEEIEDTYKPHLIHDLKYIADNLYGNFKFTQEAERNFEDWYQDGSGINNLDNGRLKMRLKGYYETKPAFVMKIAMLLKVADGDVIHKDQLILSWQNIEEGIRVIESTEGNMNEVVGDFGKNIYRDDMKSMKRFIKTNSPVMLSTILREFSAVAEPKKLKELVEGLNNSDEIIFEPKGTDIQLSHKKE